MNELAKLKKKDLSIEDLKDFRLDDIELEDVLIYIDELNDKETKIYLLKLFFETKAKKYEKANISKIRNDFFNTKDLRVRVNIIHDFISQKVISVAKHEGLNKELNDIDKRLDLMDFTSLNDAQDGYGVKTPIYKRFKEDSFVPLQQQITEVFNKIRSIYVEYNAKHKEIMERHKMELEHTEMLAKYNMPHEESKRILRKKREYISGNESEFTKEVLNKGEN
jgi:hypothetical protein